jgi:hypothetical protein
VKGYPCTTDENGLPPPTPPSHCVLKVQFLLRQKELAPHGGESLPYPFEQSPPPPPPPPREEPPRSSHAPRSVWCSGPFSCYFVWSSHGSLFLQPLGP